MIKLRGWKEEDKEEKGGEKGQSSFFNVTSHDDDE